MKLRNVPARILCLAVCLFWITQITGCGAIIYPERRGQTHGTVDPGVAVLDAACLLLFIVPGVVAFAVDFATGAIYMPGGKSRASADGSIAVAYLPPKELTGEKICATVAAKTGIEGLSLENARVLVFTNERDIASRINQAN